MQMQSGKYPLRSAHFSRGNFWTLLCNLQHFIQNY